MTEEQLRAISKRQSQEFLTRFSDYQLGSIEAEQSNPLTRNMSSVFADSVSAGVSLLVQCDCLLGDKFCNTLQSPEYMAFENAIYNTLKNDGRIVLSGCGSSGRLCMRIENSFRKAVRSGDSATEHYMDRIIALMTGGDYAVIRAVEFFEDFSALGRHQAEELHLTEKDLLIGVTATGETTSILGTAAQALDDGASVYMLVCSDPDNFFDRLPRASSVYHRERSHVLLMPCGPMALTGSTRMQSSTYEQAVLGVAVERSLTCLLGGDPLSLDNYADAFYSLLKQMTEESCIKALVNQVTLEKNCYEKNGLITYYSDEYMLDVLTDTTERSPTFMTPPFTSSTMTDQSESWAFVKNPYYGTTESWNRCFNRLPRCIEWSRDEFLSLGIEGRIVDRIPPISLKALQEFKIGNESAPKRESASESIAIWIGQYDAPDIFYAQTHKYAHKSSFTLQRCAVTPQKTTMDLFEHLAMKMMLNTFSTATMVCMDRVSGNWMTFLNISNNKLIDRAARIISQFTGLTYKKALEELFYTDELLKQSGDQEHSSTQETLKRLLKRSG